ncbi:mitochondrial ribosomal protein S25-domain-containing protein [Fomitopsis serialis]|uniref:mitochondrial ribosomal protein S25-domain-containing protein n=1 Tax=Fomitopsis serialis TaxID=139415 RepID=UPI0020081E4A|nr:mitochondrial ribosomal protein S25-domain-containing protein [Neoantrodia serialis]KAH9937229.1 mitochondrial ribosomal protein S25-domain-containing protein [Neoantrodia serialis]
MAKRIATEVHRQASRLVREGYIKKEPAWLQAVLDHPPLPLPPRDPGPRTSFDLPQDASATKSKSHSNGHPPARPSRIQYIEDQIRRQFFSDHPFETFRPTTLIEGLTIEDEHPIRGKQWTRLRQRGRNPTPEDAIRFAVNLYTDHKVPFSLAYATAVAQFRSLRSEQQFAKRFALWEARHYGMKFGPSQVEITFEKEEKALNTWAKNHDQRLEESLARKRWKAIVERESPPTSWTKGQEYTRLWQEGVRPTYGPLQITSQVAPSLPTLTPEQLQQKAMERRVRKTDVFKTLQRVEPAHV